MITPEQMQEFFEVLTTGEAPEGYTISSLPTLTPQQAFAVIYYLQERLRVLPDHYELCSECEELFNTHDGQLVTDSYSDDTEFYDDLGVTPDMVQKHSGTRFCLPECETAYWLYVVRKGEAAE